MKRRSYLAVGVGCLTTLAGCGDSTNETPQNTATNTPTPTPGSTVESTPEGDQLQEEELSEEEIDRLVEAFEIALTRSGFNPESVNLSEGYLSVVYYSATESDSIVFSERLRIAQLFTREILQQGFTPEFLQVWVSDSDVVDIQTEWVISWARNRMTNGQLLAYTELDNPGSLTNKELALEAFKFQLILSGFSVSGVSYGGNDTVRLEYASSEERFEEILDVAETYQTEFLSQDISVPTIEAAVQDGEDYTIRREWVEEWHNGEITTAGFLAYVVEF